MGRLTLNVLLSFAQFEREVTSERIRDKIAASKRKGFWVGGMVPLGYDTKERKITVNEAEVDRVRAIFRSYLKLGSMNLLMADLRKQNIFTKVRTLKTGKTVGGIPFARGALAHLLRNRFYIGEVAFKGETMKGEQPAIVDREPFEAVQAKLDDHRNNNTTARVKSEALLTGHIFDDCGNRMSPSHARKRGIKYRYYLSSALLNAQPNKSGSVSRVPAKEIETLVVKSARDHLKLLPDSKDDLTLVRDHVARVEVRSDRLVVELVCAESCRPRQKRDHQCIEISWQKTSPTRRREILVPHNMATAPEAARPIRSESRALLIAALARGRRWLKELTSDSTATIESIADRAACSPRKVNMTISLAFLAPSLVKAAIDGGLPRGMGVTRLCELPAEWSRQYRVLGLASPNPPHSNRVSARAVSVY
jgi:site-specific DNA recombinase